MSNVGWRGLNELRGQLLPILNIDVRQMERTLTFSNGGEVRVKSADSPDGLRGEGLNLAVLDECAYMHSEAWNEALRPALSDRQGGALFISTPHGLNWFRDLWLRGQDSAFPDWRSWSFKTSDNPFIKPEEIEAARLTLSGRIFRQEYEADFLEDNPGALWRREWIDKARVVQIPDLSRIIVAVDPSATATGDECGIIVAGMAKVDGRQHLYVLDDLTLQASPATWGAAVIAAYNKWHADAIIAEANQGGEMVTLTIQQAQRNAPVKLVSASRGKAVRAEPISAVYEQGRGHHVGLFARLEDELCQWEAGNASPNRLDALVWAGTELVLNERGVLIGKPRAATRPGENTTIRSMRND